MLEHFIQTANTLGVLDQAAASTGGAARPSSLFETIRAVLFTPRSWFANLPFEGPRRSVVIALVIRLVADPISLLGMSLLLPVSMGDVLERVVAAPFTALAAVYLPSGIIYGMAWLTTAGRPRFATVTTCVAYAQIPFLVGIVPVVGPVIASVWCLGLLLLALRYGLRRSWLFAWTAMLSNTLLALGLLSSLVIFRLLVFEAFKIPAPSMAPTLVTGDHILVRKLAYGWWDRRLPERGDVVVFKFPENPAQDFVKRVVGLPGDEIVVRGGAVLINGWKIPTCVAGKATVLGIESEYPGELLVEFVDDRSYLVFHSESPPNHLRSDDYQGPYKVAQGEVFVLGDNRENSHDSRGWFGGRGGGVRADQVKGPASIVWMSFDAQGAIVWPRIGAKPGEAPQCRSQFSPATCAGLERCLASRPPRSATTPPRSGERQ